MISRLRAVSTAIRPMKVVMLRSLKRVQRRACKRNCVWCAAIGHQVIITMRSPAKAVRVSFAEVSRKTLCIVANLDTPVKWTCICDVNVKSVD